MSNSKTALEWLYIEADVKNFFDQAEKEPDWYGNRYKDELQKRIQKFLDEKVDEKYHSRLNKVVRNNVYTDLAGQGKINNNVDNRWNDIREKIRYLPPKDEIRAQELATATAKAAERGAAGIKQRERKIRYEGFLDRIQEATTKEDFKKLQAELLSEKDKASDARVITDYQANQLLSVFQARKDVYYPLQPKKNLAIQSRIVSEQDLKKDKTPVRRFFGGDTYKRVLDDITVLEPWKKGRKQREDEVKSFLGSRKRMSSGGEITPRDKVYDSFLRQKNKSFVGYPEKKELLRTFERAKYPSIAKVNRLSVAQASEVRESLRREVQQEESRIFDWIVEQPTESIKGWYGNLDTNTRREWVRQLRPMKATSIAEVTEPTAPGTFSGARVSIPDSFRMIQPRADAKPEDGDDI